MYRRTALIVRWPIIKTNALIISYGNYYIMDYMIQLYLLANDLSVYINPKLLEDNLKNTTTTMSRLCQRVRTNQTEPGIQIRLLKRNSADD